MSHTLVLQSHRHPLPFPWIQACLDSVGGWADANGFDYRFIGDELFDSISEPLIHKTAQQRVVATDLARLHALQAGLKSGYHTVIWCDADFLVFNPIEFVLPDAAYALGREVWIQADSNDKPRVYKKVHNAFMMFRQGNSFLDFYAESAERLLNKNTGRISPQFIGPKLLTALHNIVICPVMETAGMLSPMVIKDIIRGQGCALDLFRKNSPTHICAANLSSSLTLQECIIDVSMLKAIEKLSTGIIETGFRPNPAPPHPQYID
jgi:hypothetical protein